MRGTRSAWASILGENRVENSDIYMFVSRIYEECMFVCCQKMLPSVQIFLVHLEYRHF